MYQTKEREGQQCAVTWLLQHSCPAFSGLIHWGIQISGERDICIQLSFIQAREGQLFCEQNSDYASPSQGTTWDDKYIKWPIMFLLFYTIKSYHAEAVPEIQTFLTNRCHFWNFWIRQTKAWCLTQFCSWLLSGHVNRSVLTNGFGK